MKLVIKKIIIKERLLIILCNSVTIRFWMRHRFKTTSTWILWIGHHKMYLQLDLEAVFIYGLQQPAKWASFIILILFLTKDVSFSSFDIFSWCFQVTKLCDLGPNDGVCSVQWTREGSYISVGTSLGKVQVPHSFE